MSTIPASPAALSPRLEEDRPAASVLRQRITASYRLNEPFAVARLIDSARLCGDQAEQAGALARRLASELRRSQGGGRIGLVQELLREYSLSSQEGVALMCLAEALLRIPDADTRDALIRDKVAKGNWREHVGRSSSPFVNAATWGLVLTGRLAAMHSEETLSAQLAQLIARGGEPLIRKGVDMAMRLLGEQFVAGENIASAIRQGASREAQGFRYSYDMLGEAAMTAADAERYRQAYEQAIHAIGRAADGGSVYQRPGISIKLSALHPRYGRAQLGRVMGELYPILSELASLARHFDVGINLDAEEADRLELSLDLLERLCFEPRLAGWSGIGFVVQAYQKRCPEVIDYLVDLARRSGHRLMVRLVKGAYWDTEIKRAQVEGQEDFAVYTRKAHTDVSYLACARRLLAAPNEVYPQFATHNAHTLAAVHTLADPERYWPGQYEFQCLHGMGEPLYEHVVGASSDGKLDRPCRIYAPVGTHETLLAYLVRRLLENGANTSFVHQISDRGMALEVLVEDPVATLERQAAEGLALGNPHPEIVHPLALYGAARANSQGLDLSNERDLARLGQLKPQGHRTAQPLVARLVTEEPAGADAPLSGTTAWRPVRNPADRRDVVGYVRHAGAQDIADALEVATAFAPTWAATPPTERVAALMRAADDLQRRMPELASLLVREAGKTWANGIAEVREAIDFLRFYAAQASRMLVGDSAGPGVHGPLGPVLCISPWNFPLAIFVGQVAAALAAGNPVLAKPAEQAPLIATEAVRVLHAGGIPAAALQLLPGEGETVGAALVADVRVQAVLFTGSIDVARGIQSVLAGRLGRDGSPVRLVAETGGVNAMIVDSSALLEQIVADVLASAFDSAGQRCSALRILCVQEDIADRLLTMLSGAMAELTVGNPWRLATDVGPVIDEDARDRLERHISGMRARGFSVQRLGRLGPEAVSHGVYVAPTWIELQRLSDLEREVFGPVLHVLRYRRQELGALVDGINAMGHGLTLGLQTRVDETLGRVTQRAHIGNQYVNRNMVGAVVGVQPFGGEGLSGTGPKAGGPLYLPALWVSSGPDAPGRALRDGLPGSWDVEDGMDPASASWPMPPEAPSGPGPVFEAFMAWLATRLEAGEAAACRQFGVATAAWRARLLAGPTGERNVYMLWPRRSALCLAESRSALFRQSAAALAVGCRVLWQANPANAELLGGLPAMVRHRVSLLPGGMKSAEGFDVVLHQGSREARLALLRRLAERPGPIIRLWPAPTASGAMPLEALVVERAISINTAAAGGNASLMTIR
ncbi:MAG: trifunctional transcriptional regulator/proline dehydrogenase/L-glutamate gamma-semialdehyde dehydrogenase [Pigmentiphaga sp.]|nr:trifunctional transcriptional regulator/proline dehydrogenase/L-glutamate gamma-semialdehyde dehydrogenase [Pigmentiphaga sp.]